MRGAFAVTAATLALLFIGTIPAAAAPALDIVHTETVRLEGDVTTTMTVSFTRWPIRARQSLDFTFEPNGGIEGKTGLVRTVSPSGDPQGLKGIILERRGDAIVLPRHPEVQEVWGLDVVALPEEGNWRFEFTLEGPEGTSTGTLPIRAIEPPGPPIELSWIVGMAPWVPVGLLLVYGWIRTTPVRRSVKPSWSG
jgi:hypothetical protein